MDQSHCTGDKDLPFTKSRESEPEIENDPRPTLIPQKDKIIETAQENCQVKKGKVCFLGPLAGYLDVSRIRQQPEEKKVKCIKGEPGSIKPILKRPTPSIPPSISSFRLKKLTEETPQVYGQGPSMSAVDDVNERRKSLGVHQSCYEITHKVNAAKKQVSLQFPVQNTSNVRICVISTCPEDLSNVPVDAILVRWKLSFTVPCYTIESVYTVLTR
ncbi:hypothetical protein Btru_022483 [Bulinus truncatus]|nr:hypothetical protein Btru_022483 [Bulinus truncatus]